MRNTIEQQMMLTAATTSAKSNSQLAGKPHSAIVTLVGSRRKSDEPQRGAMRSTPALEQPVQDTHTFGSTGAIRSNPRHPRTPAAIRDNHTFSNPGHPHIRRPKQTGAIRDTHTFGGRSNPEQFGTPTHSEATGQGHPLIQIYPGHLCIQQSSAIRNTQTSRFIQDKHILQCSPGHP